MGGRRYSGAEKQFIQDNYLKQSAKWMAEQLGRTEIAVQDQIVVLGLSKSNHWSSADKHLLRQVWGKSRSHIQKEFPLLSWQQIRIQAVVVLGLEELAVCRDAVSMSYVVNCMDYNHKDVKRWKELGLRISEDKGKGTQLSRFYIKLEDFWKFVLDNPDVIDIHRLSEGDMGVEPKEIQDLRASTDAKPRINRPSYEDKLNLVKLYYSSGLRAEDLAPRLGITADSFRHIASNMKKSGLVDGVKKFKKTRTPRFLKHLKELYYSKGLTQKQCQFELKAMGMPCSMNSVQRGLADIRSQMKAK